MKSTPLFDSLVFKPDSMIDRPFSSKKSPVIAEQQIGDYKIQVISSEPWESESDKKWMFEYWLKDKPGWFGGPLTKEDIEKFMAEMHEKSGIDERP